MQQFFAAYARQDTTEVLDDAVVATKYLSHVKVGGMELPVIEIPQSVSVVNPTRIREFNMNTIDEAMRDIPGVTTIANDYMRSQYKSRGYNMTIMPLPFVWPLRLALGHALVFSPAVTPSYCQFLRPHKEELLTICKS